MPGYTTQDIRNIALVGHGGAGKTTLAESILHNGGGSAQVQCDFEPEEKAHGHSLKTAVASVDVDSRHINLIDTPGYPDFAGPALSVLPAVETLAVVINAQRGIETTTRRMMQRAIERNLCRMIVVNKIDADNIDLPALLEQIQQSFGKECLPINLPANGGQAVIDVLNKSEGQSDFSSVEAAHSAIVDQIVEVDEQLMERYLDQGEIEPEQLHEPFEQALREGHLTPICFVSARTGAGGKELVDMFAKMMPNPLEGNPRPFLRGEGEEAEVFHAAPEADGHCIAHVFKVTTDPFVGRMGVFRIHQGTMDKYSQLYVGEQRKPFKVGHLFKLQGPDHEEVDAAIPGDICAVAKVEDLAYDAVLHDSPDDEHIHLKPLELPTPMAGFAIEAQSRGDEQKITKALSSLEAEDPCFQVERSNSTHETVIRGLGDLHLRVMLEKIKNRYHVEVVTHPPKIAYRESITASAEGHCRHKKQSGGAGQFGEVFLRVEPLERGAGFEFVDEVVGGAIPNQFIPAVEKGVRQVLEQGAVAGYPIQDVRVAVYDGKHHPVDSKEVAFVTAGKKAFIDAVRRAGPVVLEPVVSMEITVPEVNMGDIAGDLAGKRGRMQGTETLPGGMTLIRASAPLAELGSYQSQLKSITGGEGSFSMELSHYEPLPAHIQKEMTKAFEPGEEE